MKKISSPFLSRKRIFLLAVLIALPLFSLAQNDMELDKGRSDYKKLKKEKRQKEKAEKKKAKVNVEEEQRKAFEKKQKEDIKHMQDIQSDDTRKSMRQSRRKAKRFNNRKSAYPFYERWYWNFKQRRKVKG